MLGAMDETSQQPPPGLGWGTPAQPAHPRTDPAAGWGTLRRVLFWTVLGLAVPATGLGLAVVAADMADTTDDWHGLGIALGLLVAVPCTILCFLAALGLRSMRSGGPGAGRSYAVVTGLLLLATLMFIGATPAVLLPAALGGGLVLSVLSDRQGSS